MNPLTCFSLDISDHIAHLVLSRPEAMNTMNPAFWRELDAVLTQLHKSADARVLVISSTGKHFSAGMALDTFAGSITLDDQSATGFVFDDFHADDYGRAIRRAFFVFHAVSFQRAITFSRNAGSSACS